MAFMDKVFGAYDRRTATLTKTDNPFAKGAAWVEGVVVPLHEARIPLLDQGFLHSDLTYDVPAVWDGRYFRLDDHLTRFEASLVKMRLTLPLPRAEVRAIMVDMVARSGIRDVFVEIIVTRGLQFVRGTPLESHIHNLYILIMPYIWAMPPEIQRTGGSAIVARTVRRTPPGSMDPTIKNLQWGDLTRALLESHDRGALHPFLTDGDANLTEGPGYNIILIKDGVLYTPDRGVLEGVTRKSVMEIARANGIEVRKQVVPVELAYQADEIFTCTTAGGVMPITSLDERPVKDGQIGPITRIIWEEYWEMHYNPQYSFVVEYDNRSHL
ncbi:hypothetical protein PV08_08795 [Exophiala spinifera]|uniref:Branched-chain amino acid aminotransferase n=1 Tax=Exophiala spinifera TaxID=91928 RepID=A0A0D2B4J4_9EURO|nr:uncharacterized protein PV08_08795 [Exophiala spinifera]KIW13605.1 hypothetical protein PV08_08795 [Exophiala spinifera]